MSTKTEKVWQCDKCHYVLETDGEYVFYDPSPDFLGMTHVLCGGKFVPKDLKYVCLCN